MLGVSCNTNRNCMIKEDFKFKTQLFSINGIYNIPGHIICSGFGYDFQTYCCKNCGELFVVNLENVFHKKVDLNSLLENKNCPTCNSPLKENLLKYPENIFYNNQLLKNLNSIDRVHFDNTYTLEVFTFI